MTTLTTAPKETQGPPVETKDVLKPMSQKLQAIEQVELLEGLEQSFTLEELPGDTTQKLKTDLLSLIKQLPKSQQELFSNLAIIGVETAKDNHKLSELYGLDIAIQQLGKDPTKKIILTGFMLSEKRKPSVMKIKPNETALLFNHPHVETIDFLELLADPQTGIDLVIRKHTQQQMPDISTREEAFLKLIEQKIWVLLHDMRYVVSLPTSARSGGKIGEIKAFFQLAEKSEKQTKLENEMLELLQLQHPEYATLARDEKLEKIIAFFQLADAIVLPEGTRFDGVFVDRDGTLYDTDTKKIKEETLKIIKDFQTQGEKVTVRTLGDVQRVQEILQQAGIALPVKSKTEFKGGTVGIAIDDLSEEELFHTIKVKSERHIQV